jgi:hypothetical protein
LLVEGADAIRQAVDVADSKHGAGVRFPPPAVYLAALILGLVVSL